MLSEAEQEEQEDRDENDEKNSKVWSGRRRMADRRPRESTARHGDGGGHVCPAQQQRAKKYPPDGEK